MQACAGSTTMNSIQQSLGIKGSVFPSNWIGINGCPNHVRFTSIKPCRSSQLDGNLVTGRPPSSVSVPIPAIGGSIL